MHFCGKKAADASDEEMSEFEEESLTTRDIDDIGANLQDVKSLPEIERLKASTLGSYWTTGCQGRVLSHTSKGKPLLSFTTLGPLESSTWVSVYTS